MQIVEGNPLTGWVRLGNGEELRWVPERAIAELGLDGAWDAWTPESYELYQEHRANADQVVEMTVEAEAAARKSVIRILEHALGVGESE